MALKLCHRCKRPYLDSEEFCPRCPQPPFSADADSYATVGCALLTFFGLLAAMIFWVIFFASLFFR